MEHQIDGLLKYSIDLTKIMKESRNEEELRHAWTEWHDKCGNDVMKKSYERFAVLSNRVAHLNGIFIFLHFNY